MIPRFARHFFSLSLLSILTGTLPIASGIVRQLSAQTIDAAPIVPDEVPELQEPPLLPPPEELLRPSPSDSEPVEEVSPSIPDTIIVERFEFVGSTVFSDRELAAVTTPYTNRPISFAELLEARSAVTQLYVDAGYITSGALIPPQTIEAGVVRIEIVEGSLEAIDVRVEGRLVADYVRDRLNLAISKPLNVNRLLEALQLLQLDPLIEKISAQLSAGSLPGTNILSVGVETASSFKARIALDNGRVPIVGSFRRGVQLSEANLLGYGDRLEGSYFNTDGSDDLAFAYTLPLNPRNGTLKLEYRTISSQIVEPPLNALDITSDYQQYALTLRQPVWQTSDREFALGLTFDRQESRTVLPLSGSDSEGRTEVSTLRFFQEWIQRSETEVLAARSEFNFGIDAFGITKPVDASVNPDAPSNRYFIWRGQTQWVRLLAPDTLIVARTDLQLADRPVVSLEQFALGGFDSVLGYPQNTLLTDNGLFASLELRLPIYRNPQYQTVVQIIPFVNIGTGWNNGGDTNLEIDTLASVGLGLQWQEGNWFKARLDWGIPLTETPSSGDSLQERGLYFSIIVNPF